MANTYTLIASSTVGSGGAAYVEFTSISSSYTDLKLVGSTRSARADSYIDYVTLLINGSTSSRSMKRIFATGNTPGTDAPTQLLAESSTANSTSNAFGSFEYYLPNYNSNSNKTVTIDSTMANNSTSDIQSSLSAGIRSDSAAITSLRMETASGNNFVQYSTFYLYGIKNS